MWESHETRQYIIPKSTLNIELLSWYTYELYCTTTRSAFAEQRKGEAPREAPRVQNRWRAPRVQELICICLVWSYQGIPKVLGEIFRDFLRTLKSKYGILYFVYKLMQAWQTFSRTVLQWCNMFRPVCAILRELVRVPNIERYVRNNHCRKWDIKPRQIKHCRNPPHPSAICYSFIVLQFDD